MIQATHLSKHFKVAQPGRGLRSKIKAFFSPQHKTIKAVDDISFAINKGEIVGFLGPNGAGKSTTIKLLTGVLIPTSGTVEVNGLAPYKNRTHNAHNIGVVYGQRSQLWWDLPLIDSFEALSTMYKIPKQCYQDTLNFVVELLDMGEFIDQPVRKLSLGQKMRGDIAASLLHTPPILYLDEPTIGLDIITKKRILQFFRKLKDEKNVTILFTTHNLSDVEQLCQRIMIVDKGKIILDASKKEILDRFGTQRSLIVEFQNEVRDIDLPEGRIVRKEENKLWIEFNRERISAFDLATSLGQSQKITDISIKEADIESIVTKIYQNGV